MPIPKDPSKKGNLRIKFNIKFPSKLSAEQKLEVLVVFPHLVNLPPEKFQAALAHILQGSAHPGAVLTPSEVLIAIHGIDSDRDAIPLKKITDACNACFEQPQIFTQQVIAKVLNPSVEQIPLPLLFRRTVLQAIGAYPALLPPPQLENALNRTQALKAPLVAHQPNIKSSPPRSVLVVLGIVTDAPTASQAQTVDTSNSDKEAQTEMTKESSNATLILTANTLNNHQQPPAISHLQQNYSLLQDPIVIGLQSLASNLLVKLTL